MFRSSILALGCAAALCPLTLQADFTDHDSFFGVTPVSSGNPLNGIFDFRTGGDPTDLGLEGLDALGYDPLTQVVNSFLLSIQLASSQPGQQNVTMSFDGHAINTFFTGSLSFGGTLSSADETALKNAAQDGRINYSFAAADAASSYEVNYAEMTIKTGSQPPPSNGVPDAGSTGALLALALGGFGLFGRKLRR